MSRKEITFNVKDFYHWAHDTCYVFEDWVFPEDAEEYEKEVPSMTKKELKIVIDDAESRFTHIVIVNEPEKNKNHVKFMNGNLERGFISVSDAGRAFTEKEIQEMVKKYGATVEDLDEN